MSRALMLIPLLLSLASASRAHAGDDVLASEAQQRFQEGLALHDAGREDEAYAKFAQAYAVVKAPAVLFNLARTEQLTGRLLEANQHFRQYIELPADSPRITPELRQKAHEFRADIRTRLGHVAVTATAGAALSLDGQPLARPAPLSDLLDVIPGPHAIEAHLGARTERASIAVAANQTQSVTLDVAPPVEIAHLPLVAMQPASMDASARTSQEALTPTRTWVALGLGAAALGAVAAGVALEGSASSDADRANQLSAQIPSGASACFMGSAACQQRNDATHAAQDKRNVAAGMFIAGGVVAMGAVAVLLLGPRSAKPGSALGIGPMLAPAVLGARLAGSF